MQSTTQNNILTISKTAIDTALKIALFVTIFCVFVPFIPNMPTAGLDPSWTLGMNEAVAQGFSIGKQIVFTFGPYASIYTKYYHPSTDWLMLFGAIVLAVSYAVSYYYVSNSSRWRWTVALIVYFSAGAILRDTLLYSCNFIIGLSIFNIVRAKNQTLSKQTAESKLFDAVVLGVICLPLGLVPLIKGSMLLSSITTVLICSFFLIVRNEKKLALISILSPLISAVFFWWFSGQNILDLLSFIRTMLPIISGYSDAMSSVGNIFEILFYITASTSLLASILYCSQISRVDSLYLSAVFFTFLFLSFKGGFVRHDGHAMLAANSIVLGVLLLNIMIQSKLQNSVIVLSLLSWFVIDIDHNQTSTANMINNVVSTYSSAWNGLNWRLNRENWPRSDFDQAIQAIKRQENLPLLSGTTDIYSFDQSALIASGNKWSPRPIFQSYSAYTPSLQALNEQHLLGKDAPDNILYRIQPIDGRIPSLEDGRSLSVLLRAYEPTKSTADLLYLKKRSGPISEESQQTLTEGEAHFFDVVNVPESDRPIFSKFQINTTLFGKIANFLFKTEQLQITYNLKNGEKRTFRLISEMTKAGFIMSPLIEKTSDFEFMFAKPSFLDQKKVVSFTVSPAGWGTGQWNSKFKFQMYKLNTAAPVDISTFYQFDKFETDLHALVHSSNDKCEGAIDYINGVLSPKHIKAEGLLEVNGWLSTSVENGLLPDAIYVSLTNRTGQTIYIDTQHTQRPDVGVYLNKLPLANSGFKSAADVSSLVGDFTLGLVVQSQGIVRDCAEFKIPVQFAND